MYCIGPNSQKRNEVKIDNVYFMLKLEHNLYLVHTSLKNANILLPADSDGPALRLWVLNGGSPRHGNCKAFFSSFGFD